MGMMSLGNVGTAMTQGMRIASMAGRTAANAYKKARWEINGAALGGITFHLLSKISPRKYPITTAEGVLAGFQLGAAIHIAKMTGRRDEVLTAATVNMFMEVLMSWVELDFGDRDANGLSR